MASKYEPRGGMKGHVYVVDAGDGVVKVGSTGLGRFARLSVYTTEFGSPGLLAWTSTPIRSYRAVERALVRQFADAATDRGPEWLRVDFAKVTEMAATLVQSVLALEARAA